MEEDCVSWIYDYFGECVRGIRSGLSFWIGLSSILFWLFAQFPQIRENYINKAAEGLAPLFLLWWLLGDVCNLIGCFLTHQLPTQTVTAIYFVSVDFILISQFLFYERICCGGKKPKDALETEKLVNSTTTSTPTLYSVFVFFIFAAMSSTLLLANAPTDTTSRLLKGEDDISHKIGYAIGWLSAILYLSSRAPQIIKNKKRKSVEGLSILMFFFAVMGNLTYTTGILLYSTEYNYLIAKLPWLLGSAGTFVFDFTLIGQFFYYKKTKYQEIKNEN